MADIGNPNSLTTGQVIGRLILFCLALIGIVAFVLVRDASAQPASRTPGGSSYVEGSDRYTVVTGTAAADHPLVANNPHREDVVCVIVEYVTGESSDTHSIIDARRICAQTLQRELLRNSRQRYYVEGHYNPERYATCQDGNGQQDVLCQQELAEDRQTEDREALHELGIPSSSLWGGEAIEYSFKGSLVYRIPMGDDISAFEAELARFWEQLQRLRADLDEERRQRMAADSLLLGLITNQPQVTTPQQTIIIDGTCRNGGVDDDNDGVADHRDPDCLINGVYHPELDERTPRPWQGIFTITTGFAEDGMTVGGAIGGRAEKLGGMLEITKSVSPFTRTIPCVCGSTREIQTDVWDASLSVFYMFTERFGVYVGPTVAGFSETETPLPTDGELPSMIWGGNGGLLVAFPNRRGVGPAGRIGLVVLPAIEHNDTLVMVRASAGITF